MVKGLVVDLLIMLGFSDFIRYGPFLAKIGLKIMISL